MKYLLSVLIIATLITGCSNGNGPDQSAPVMSSIPDQAIAKNEDFAQIDLDNYVSDADHADNQLTWSYSGNSELSIDITNRVATISKPTSEWVGTDTVVFKATDPDMLMDEDTAVFSVVDSLAFNASYFPVADGDTWYYTSQSLGQVVRMVAGDTTINGRACIRVLEGGVTAEAWSLVEDGVSAGYYIHLLSLGSVFYEFEPPLKIPFDMEQDEVYNYEATVTKYVSGTVDEIFDISGNLRFEGFVDYSVPAGDFENVIQLYYIEDDYNEYYAPGVGLLDNEDYVLDSAYIDGVWYK
jgi:hypothetical protein